jgi:gas vesicle protein
LKTDISDLRTNIKDLVNDNINIKEDILAINPSGDIMLDNDSNCTISSSIHELENKVYEVQDSIDNKVADIKEHIEHQETEIKKVSKVSKMSLLNSIHNWIV